MHGGHSTGTAHRGTFGASEVSRYGERVHRDHRTRRRLVYRLLRRDSWGERSGPDQEARESLAEAIKLVLEDRREDALRGMPSDAMRETVTVK